jgi:hypothetical protein
MTIIEAIRENIAGFSLLGNSAEGDFHFKIITEQNLGARQIAKLFKVVK